MNKIEIRCTEEELETIIGSLEDAKISKETITKLQECFKQAESNRGRTEKGNKYYIVDSTGEVISVEEQYTATDNNLYKSGNYFKEMCDAEFYSLKWKAIFLKNTKRRRKLWK